MPGIDVPTLRDVWATAPYPHDGRAPTLGAAVQAHAGNTVTGTDLNNLVAYLQQIGNAELIAPGTLIQSAKLNGLDTYEYLRDVLTRLPTHKASRIAELLPHKWAGVREG